MPTNSQQSNEKYEEFLRGLELISVGLKGCSASLDRSSLSRIWREKKTARVFKDSYKVTEIGIGYFEASGSFLVRVQESQSASLALLVECEFEAHLHATDPISKAFVGRFVNSEFKLILVPYARQFVASVTATMSIPPLVIPLSINSGKKPKPEKSIAKTSKD
jgi:hypothetical protein